MPSCSYLTQNTPDRHLSTSPFIMPFRLLNENVPAIDIGISIVLLIAAIVLVSIVSVRLYSASVLHYGQRLKIREIFKLKV